MPRPFVMELRSCFLGALNPALTRSKNRSRESRAMAGSANMSMRTTEEVTLGAGLNARGGAWHTMRGLP